MLDVELKEHVMILGVISAYLKIASMENKAATNNLSSKECNSLKIPFKGINNSSKVTASDKINVPSPSYSVFIEMPSSPSRPDRLKCTSISEEEVIQNHYIERQFRQLVKDLYKLIMKDKRFDSVKTWSGRLERHFSSLRGKTNVNNDIEARDSELKV